MQEKDLKNYSIRTDLVVDMMDSNFTSQKIISKKETFQDIQILEVTITSDENELKKKKGKYITISYQDVTDKTNFQNLEKVVIKELKKIIKVLNLTDKSKCLVVGLGNIKSTPDALGPKTVADVMATRYLYEIDEIEVDPNYRNVATFIPGVTGETGIESSDIVLGIIEKIKPDFVITIDALASSSMERVNKTIQITDSGIHPGSGVYNNRKELSYETLHIPVISIGIPTVIEAFVLVSDTIGYLLKHFSYNKENYQKNKLIPVTMRNYLEHDINLTEEEKTKLLGEIGTLSEEEVKELIFEVLTPIGYNMMITPKEIDLLKLLVEHKGLVLTRSQMLDNLWGADYPIIDRTIDTYIKNLRKKLRLDCIVTVKGIGYKFEVET